MGNQSKVRKSRVCLACGKSIHSTALELQDHNSSCARMARLGLVTPGLLVDGEAQIVLDNAHKRKKALRPSMGGRA